MTPPRLPTPPHLRRYGWLRLYTDFPHHPKWRALAGLTGLPLHEILAVAVVLLCKGNVGQPRGSLAEFSPVECAAAIDLPAGRVMRIYAAMEEIGWIDGERLVTWDERQPDREDPTNAERQRRYRARRRAERDSLRNGVTRNSVTAQDERNGVTAQDERNGDENQRNTVTRNSVTASRRREQARLRMRRMRAKLKAAAPAPARNGVTSVTSRPDQTRSSQAVNDATPVDCVDWRESAAAWLAGDGLEIVRRHGRLLVSQAQIRIGRWRSAAGNDEALRDLIHSCAALAAEGRFLHLVGEGVARLVRERATGAALPLPPVALSRRESGRNS